MGDIEKTKPKKFNNNFKSTRFDNIYKHYNICWLLHESTSAISRNGELLEGISTFFEQTWLVTIVNGWNENIQQFLRVNNGDKKFCKLQSHDMTLT